MAKRKRVKSYPADEPSATKNIAAKTFASQERTRLRKVEGQFVNSDISSNPMILSDTKGNYIVSKVRKTKVLMSNFVNEKNR